MQTNQFGWRWILWRAYYKCHQDVRTIGKAVLAMRARRIMKSSASQIHLLTLLTEINLTPEEIKRLTQQLPGKKVMTCICPHKRACHSLRLLHLISGWDWLRGGILRAPMVLTFVSRWAYCEWSWKVLPSWWHTWGGAFFVSLVVWSNRSSNVYSGLLQTVYYSRHPLFKIEKGRRRQQNNWS